MQIAVQSFHLTCVWSLMHKSMSLCLSITFSSYLISLVEIKYGWLITQYFVSSMSDCKWAQVNTTLMTYVTVQSRTKSQELFSLIPNRISFLWHSGSSRPVDTDLLLVSKTLSWFQQLHPSSFHFKLSIQLGLVYIAEVVQVDKLHANVQLSIFINTQSKNLNTVFKFFVVNGSHVSHALINSHRWKLLKKMVFK